jgi:hypothetical protein
MDLCQSVLPGTRQITATELSREDRALELARLAQVQIGQPGLLSNFVIRLTVSALASERVPDGALDDAWLDYGEAARLYEDTARGGAMGAGFGLVTCEAERDKALSVLLDGSTAA